MNANSCADYLQPFPGYIDPEPLNESDLLPELGELSWNTRAELAEAVVSRIDGIRTMEFER